MTEFQFTNYIEARLLLESQIHFAIRILEIKGHH
jgi:hypothetical protein